MRRRCTEVFWSALHGPATLNHGARLRPTHQRQRLDALIAWPPPSPRTPFPGNKRSPSASFVPDNRALRRVVHRGIGADRGNRVRLERVDWWWRRSSRTTGIQALIHDQQRIVSRVQLFAAGWSEPRIRQPLRGRRWQTVHPGVYATHTGPIGYDERLLAALLYAGPEAAWSHYTAAEQLGLLKPDRNRPVYVTIPERRRVRPRPEPRHPPRRALGRPSRPGRTTATDARGRRTGHRRTQPLGGPGSRRDRRGMPERPGPSRRHRDCAGRPSAAAPSAAAAADPHRCRGRVTLAARAPLPAGRGASARIADRRSATGGGRRVHRRLLCRLRARGRARRPLPPRPEPAVARPRPGQPRDSARRGDPALRMDRRHRPAVRGRRTGASGPPPHRSPP